MKQLKRLGLLLFFIIIIGVLAACSSTDNQAEDETGDDVKEEAGVEENESPSAESQSVQVDLENGDEESVGTATLGETTDGVQVTLEGENLSKGTHAFHIHEKGACEAPDFKSAGGHYNPEDTDHGYDTEDGPHAGDMPNIAVGEDGTVEQSFLVQGVSLDKDAEKSLTADDGTALVIHEGADDGESQPSGDAGNRSACGTISNE